MFFVDLEGGEEAERSMSERIAGVREVLCEELRVLGSTRRPP